MKNYKKLLYIIIAIMGFILIGCDKENKKLPIATIDVEEFGIIRAELYPNKAPNTVNNFINLADIGFYDGLKFHRITNSLIQTGLKKNEPNYKIKGEFKDNNFDENDIKHEKGTLSMVRIVNDNNSASSQFFILKEKSPHMDGTHSAFGKVIEGMDVVDKIGAIEVNRENNKPKKEVKIKSITVDKKGIKYDKPEIIEN